MPGMRGGEQYLLGVILDVDAKGMVAGASIASQSLHNTERVAKKTAEGVRKHSNDMQAGFMRAAGQMVIGYGLLRAASKVYDGVIGKSVSVAEGFEKKMTDVKFVTGAGLEEMKEYRDFALQTGMETVFTPTQAAEGIYELKSAGLATDRALKSLRSTLDLVALSGGELDLGGTSEVMGMILNKFSDTNAEAQDVADQFATAIRTAPFHPKELAPYMRAIGSAPKLFEGVRLEEIIGIGAAGRYMGKLPAQLGNAVIGFYRRMTEITKVQRRTKDGAAGMLYAFGFSKEEFKKRVAEIPPELIKAYETATEGEMRKRSKGKIIQTLMDTLGEEIPGSGGEVEPLKFFDDTGKFRGTLNVLSDITDAMSNIKTEEGQALVGFTLFGMQAQDVLKSVQEFSGEAWGRTEEEKALRGGEALKAYVGMLKDSKGAARAAAEEQLKTWWGVKLLWSGSMETLGVLLGLDVVPFLSKIVGRLYEWLNVVIGLVKENKVFGRVILGTAAAVSVLASVFGLMFLTAGMGGLALQGLMFATGEAGLAAYATSGAFGVLKVAVTQAATAVWSSFVAALPILVAVGLVAYGLYRVYKMYSDDAGTFGKRVRTAWRGLKDGIAIVVPAIIAAFAPFDTALSAMGDAMINVFEAFGITSKKTTDESSGDFYGLKNVIVGFGLAAAYSIALFATGIGYAAKAIEYLSSFKPILWAIAGYYFTIGLQAMFAMGKTLLFGGAAFILKGFSAAALVATAAQWAFNIAGMANPYAIVAATLVLLVGTLYVLGEALEENTRFWEGLLIGIDMVLIGFFKMGRVIIAVATGGMSELLSGEGGPFGGMIAAMETDLENMIRIFDKKGVELRRRERDRREEEKKQRKQDALTVVQESMFDEPDTGKGKTKPTPSAKSKLIDKIAGIAGVDPEMAQSILTEFPGMPKGSYPGMPLPSATTAGAKQIAQVIHTGWKETPKLHSAWGKPPSGVNATPSKKEFNIKFSLAQTINGPMESSATEWAQVMFDKIQALATQAEEAGEAE